MHHTLTWRKVIPQLWRSHEMSAMQCDCGKSFFWITPTREEMIKRHLAPGDTYEFVEDPMPQIKGSLLDDPNVDPNVEPDRVTWPPVEPPESRFTPAVRKRDKTSMIGDLQVTEVYTNSGKWILQVFHMPTATSLSVYSKEEETPRMLKVRALRMMAAALRASSLGAMG